MNRLLVLGMATVGGVMAFRCLPRESRHRLTTAGGSWVAERMKHMIARLPEDAPPKLIMSILPKLREQNDQIIAMLQEQNELLRKQQTAQISR
jgi:hypothetical protein